jgi:hypothetical protein
MMRLDGSACQQFIAALEDGHESVKLAIGKEIDPAIKRALEKRFQIILLLAVSTAVFLGALNIFQLFDDKYSDKIKYSTITGSVLLLLLGLLGYLTIRQTNDKHLGLEKKECTLIKTHGFQATELAKLLDTESTLNAAFNKLTKRTLHDGGQTLSKYSNTSDALKALDRIQSATQHAQFLISNPSISSSNEDCHQLTNTLAAAFKTMYYVNAEFQWKQFTFISLYLLYTTFMIGIPTGLSIASTYENNHEKFVSLGISVLSAFLGVGIQYILGKMNDDLPSPLKEAYAGSISEVIGSLLKYFPEDQMENIDRRLVSIIIDELRNASKRGASLPANIQQSKNVQAALDQAVVFAKAKFTQFKLPEKDSTQQGERLPLLKGAQQV